MSDDSATVSVTVLVEVTIFHVTSDSSGSKGLKVQEGGTHLFPPDPPGP